MSQAIFILILAGVPIDARAQWAALVEKPRRWYVDACDSRPAIEPDCAPGTVAKVAGESLDIAKVGYLQGLATEAAAGQECLGDEMQKLTTDAGAGDRVFADVKRQLAQLRSTHASLEAARNEQDDAVRSLGGGGRSAADLAKDVTALETLEAAQVAAIPFANHPLIQKFVRTVAQTPEGVRTDDRAGWDAALRAALQDTRRSQLRWAQRAGGTRKFEDVAKEQLAQDPVLIEAYFARHPERAGPSRAAACAVDREYGRGAVRRAAAVKIGAVVATTLLVPPMRAVARPLGGVILETLAATRVAGLARGLAGAQVTTRLLATAAVALDLKTASNAIDTACGASHVSTAAHPTKAGSCESVDVRSLGARRCAEVGILTALGAGLGSPAALALVQSFLKSARAAAGLAELAPAVEDARLVGVANGAKVYRTERSGVTLRLDSAGGRPKVGGSAPANRLPAPAGAEVRTPAAKASFGEGSETVTIGRAEAPNLRYVAAPRGERPGLYNIEARDPAAAASELARLARPHAPSKYSEAQIAKLIQYGLGKARDLGGRLSICFERDVADVPKLRLSIDAAPADLGRAKLVRTAHTIEGATTTNPRFELDLRDDAITYMRGNAYTQAEAGVVQTGVGASHGFAVFVRPEGVEVTGRIERMLTLPEARGVIDAADEIGGVLGHERGLIRLDGKTGAFEHWQRSGDGWVKKD